jgi:GDP-L-fucose synthase
MEKNARIYVAGHRGLVGSAIVRELLRNGYTNLICATPADVDLRIFDQVYNFFKEEKPEYVFLAAAKVGGIGANNKFPVDFLQDNLEIQSNVIQMSHHTKVKKLLFLGSSCIYPRMAQQPISEESLLAGPLEATNQWYAIAKIAGIKMCQAYHRQYGCDFISLMPTNLYGIGDNFDLESAHVLPAMIRKFHEAKEAGHGTVEMWGTGSPFREFLYVDDLARACLFLMEKYSSDEIINVGYGSDISIRELAETIQKVVGFRGDIVWDHSRPDGTPKKLLNSWKLREMGWKAEVPLSEGLKKTYDWFQANPKGRVYSAC